MSRYFDADSWLFHIAGSVWLLSVPLLSISVQLLRARRKSHGIRGDYVRCETAIRESSSGAASLENADRYGQGSSSTLQPVSIDKESLRLHHQAHPSSPREGEFVMSKPSCLTR